MKKKYAINELKPEEQYIEEEKQRGPENVQNVRDRNPSIPTSSNSSALYRLDTSPLLRMLLMSSRNDSSTTWTSMKRNTVALLSTPALQYSRFRSS